MAHGTASRTTSRRSIARRRKKRLKDGDSAATGVSAADIDKDSFRRRQARARPEASRPGEKRERTFGFGHPACAIVCATPATNDHPMAEYSAPALLSNALSGNRDCKPA